MAPVVATENLVVFDEQMGIHRKLMAGQPVPADLVPAYEAAVGTEAAAQDPGEAAGSAPAPAPAPAVDYDAMSVEDVELEVGRRGLNVVGTGAHGNVLKKDNVAALLADDQG